MTIASPGDIPEADTRPVIRRPSVPESVRIRMRTLLWVRWLSMFGQTVAILIVDQIIGFTVPLVPCLLVVAAGIPVNLYFRFNFKGRRLRPREMTASLAFDILQLGALLYMTGGLQNPFAFFLIAPVIMAAATLPRLYVKFLGILSIAVASLLTRIYQPLPWYPGAEISLPQLIIYGYWSALVISQGFFAFVVNRIASEARALADALTATEVALMNEQHLNALDGLAAAAAHELGTPLSTISVIARDLERAADAADPDVEDFRLLKSQAERCRTILSKIRQLPSEGEVQMAQLPLMSLLEEVTEPHRHFGVEIQVGKSTYCSDAPEPIFPRHPGILYGLGNLIENAVDFAKERVDITVSWTSAAIDVTIRDDGPGFSPQVIDRLGEPYVTTRENRTTASAGGLGLGLFISKTLLERSGARFEIQRSLPGTGGGAAVRLIWAAVGPGGQD